MEDTSAERNLFSWIHLSDIHFRHGNEHSQIDQEMVLQSLITDISKTIENSKRNIPRPDAIFVTGDIAYSGATVYPDEYGKAELWLDKIGKVANLDHKQIFVIPGNHDVQRNVYTIQVNRD